MSNTPKVTIGVILFKGEKYLELCLRSLLAQDYPNIEFLFRDQSPNGEAYEYIQNYLPGIFHKVSIEKGGNLWHSGGHNELIRKMTGDYYFCCSNDMLYPNDFVSKIVTEMEKPHHHHYGSATCKLMQWDFETAERGDIERSKTYVIDSFGIAITKGHQFFDIGQGEVNEHHYEGLKQVFGPSGALAVYRKKALEDIAYRAEGKKPEYFDSLLHYKNDVDLAYRLQWSGHPCLFIPETTVYHDRQVDKKTKKSTWVKGNSLFGHLVAVRKNYSKEYSLMVRVKTALLLLLRYIHTTVLNAELLEQYDQVKKFMPEIKAKRAEIVKRVPPKKIEELMI